jgi:hypothetical protein
MLCQYKEVKFQLLDKNLISIVTLVDVLFKSTNNYHRIEVYLQLFQKVLILAKLEVSKS